MDFELQAVNILKKDMSDAEKTQFDVQFASRRKNPALALILSLFLGQFGIDRFYLGHIGLGVGKLLTFGGLYFWAIVDWFVIMGSTRKSNIQLAKEIRRAMLEGRPRHASADVR